MPNSRKIDGSGLERERHPGGKICDSAMSDTNSGAYALRTTDFGDFTKRWHALTGGGFPMPAFSPATMTNFRVRFRATRVRDVAITGADGSSAIRTAGGPGPGEDHVRLWLVRR